MDIIETVDCIFSTPSNTIKDFTFNDEVTKVFTNMIRRSIPGYLYLLESMGLLIEKFSQSNSTLYDIGSSLGASTQVLQKYSSDKKGCEIIAIDNSASMVRAHKKLLYAQMKDTTQRLAPIKVIEGNALDIKFSPASVVILNFTLQFLPISQRLQLLKNIFKSLIPGGILILSEKLSFEEKEVADIFQELHVNFKRMNGYSDLEISQKGKAIQDIMIPDTLQSHQKRLSKAGYSRVIPWFQSFNFISLIAQV